MVNKSDFSSNGVIELTIGGDLSTVSVEEMSEKILILENEINRMKLTLSKKREALKAADNFFKS